MKSIKELKARREDCRLKAVSIIEKAEKEDRFLTEEENRELTKLENEIRGWDTQIVRFEVFKEDKADDEKKPASADEEEKPTNPETPKEEVGKDNERKFRSLGEQMMAVYRASQPGARVDTRLTTRSASGLN